MNILYIGDIMAKPGRDVVCSILPALRAKHKVDLVIAQAENVTHGKGMSPYHMRELQAAGVDVFSGGNHSPERKDLHEMLDDPAVPVLSPANLLAYPASWGAKTVATPRGKVLVASLLGQIVPKSPPMANPLKMLDDILAARQDAAFAAIVVNFHGDYSSEKRVMGYYADGRVSAVIGDHWHVPTADAMVLPKGTAHISDVGMCGTLHSSLGVQLEVITKRWRHGVPLPNRIAVEPPYQFNAVLVDVNTRTGLARKITPIRQTLEKI